MLALCAAGALLYFKIFFTACLLSAGFSLAYLMLYLYTGSLRGVREAVLLFWALPRRGTSVLFTFLYYWSCPFVFSLYTLTSLPAYALWLAIYLGKALWRPPFSSQARVVLPALLTQLPVFLSLSVFSRVFLRLLPQAWALLSVSALLKHKARPSFAFLKHLAFSLTSLLLLHVPLPFVRRAVLIGGDGLKLINSGPWARKKVHVWPLIFAKAMWGVLNVHYFRYVTELSLRLRNV